MQINANPSEQLVANVKPPQSIKTTEQFAIRLEDLIHFVAAYPTT